MTMMDGGGPPGSLPCQPGEEFTDYVRSKLKPFPPCSPYQAGNSLERTALWPGRRAEFQAPPGQQHEKQTAKVVKWTEWTTGFACPYTMWKLTLEKADGNQVTVSVAKADVAKGGQVVLTDASEYGMPDVLKWLDPPMEPVEEDESSEDEEEG